MLGAALPGWTAASQVQVVRGVYLVFLDGVEWPLLPEAFGVSQIVVSADILGKELHLSIPAAEWPGTGVTYDLDLRFVVSNGRWQLNIKSVAFSLDVNAPYAEFVRGYVPIQTLTSGALLKSLASAVGWVAPPGQSGTLSFASDLSWALRCQAGFRAAKVAVSTDALFVRAHGAGLGPFDDYVASPATSTIAVAGEVGPTARELKLNYGTTQGGRVVELWPRTLSRVSTVRWSDGRKADALDGVWGLRIGYAKKRGVAHFDGLTGQVLLGADVDGMSYSAADLRMPECCSSSAINNVGALLGPNAGEHGLELRTVDGVIERCVLRAALLHLAIPVEGADFSRLEFDGQDIVLLLDETPAGVHEPTELVLGRLDQWKIPLARARLRVTRVDDLLSITFRFRTLSLESSLTGWWLRGQDEGVAPALLAELPGQHVLEEAFLKLVVDDADGGETVGRIGPPDAVDNRKVRDHVSLSIKELDRDYSTAHDDPNYPGEKTLQDIAEARLSDPSRLVFALPTHGRKKKVDYPLTLERLTDWKALRLIVPHRAKSFSAKGADWIEHTLGYFNVQAGQNISTRLGDVTQPACAGPQPFETAIEIPARLLLCPDQNARFQTQNFAPRRVKNQRITPLWSARLDVGSGQGRLRAIGSPDFSAASIRDKVNNPEPSRDNTPPWDDPLHPPPNPRTLRLPLNKNDRHQLVALTSLYGLPTLPRLNPAIPAQPDELEPSNFAAPPGWQLNGIDPKEQGIYIPPAMPTEELALTSLGGSLAINARFEPPAAPYLNNDPLYPALSVETWNQESVLGRDVFVEVIYKGFLLPVGHRASLVKRTERYFLRGPSRGPTAYLIQRYFIRINHPERSYPRIGHPFDARDFPLQSVRFKTIRTPDIQDPFETNANPVVNGIGPQGQIALKRGFAFWPRVRPNIGGEVLFDVMADSGPGGFTAPLIFVDNTAVHDPEMVEAVVDHYNTRDPRLGLRTANFRGASQRYAPEKRPGASRFATARWILSVRGRVDAADRSSQFKMTAAMEGQDQPPFYPVMSEAHVLLRSLQQFSNHTADFAVVSFDPDYVRNGLSQDANPAKLYLDVHGYLPSDPKDWFKAQLEPVRMDLNGSGDRAGGVAQPNIIAVCFSTDNGPVGGPVPAMRPITAPPAGPVPTTRGAPAGGPAPTAPPTPKPAEAARAGLMTGLDFFPADARLLGLLPFRDLIKTALIDFAPKLVEKVQVAETEAEAQLKEVLAAIQTVARKGIDDLIQVLTRSLAIPPAMQQLYPRLVAAVSAANTQALVLKAALDNSSGAALGRIEAIVDGAGRFNDRVGDLLTELDRVVADPIPPVLRDTVDDLAKIVTEVRGFLTPGNLQKQVVQSTLDGLKSLCADRGKELWLATCLGPDAYGATCKNLDTTKPQEAIHNLVETLGRTASEAICYDSVGKPVFQFLSVLGAVADKSEAALNGDIKALSHGAMQLTLRALDFCQQVVLGPLTQQVLQVIGGAPAVCKLAGDIVTNVLAGADGILGKAADLDRYIANAQQALASLADIEMRAARSVADGRQALDRVRQQPSVPPSAIRNMEFALGTIEAALEVTTRVRRSAGAVFDKVKAAISALNRERDNLVAKAADLSTHCDVPTMSGVLSSATTLSTLRMRALSELGILFRHIQEAIAILPSISGPPPAPFVRGAVDDATAAAMAVVSDFLDPLWTILQQALCLLRDLSSLRDPKTRTALQKLATDLSAAVSNAQVDAGSRLKTLGETLVSPATNQLENDLQTLIKRTVPTDLSVLRDVMAQALAVRSNFDRYIAESERALIAALLQPAASLDDTRFYAVAWGVLKPLVDALVEAHARVLGAWDQVIDSVKPLVREALERFLRADLKDLLSKSSTLHTDFTDQQTQLTAAQTILKGTANAAGLKAVLDSLLQWCGRLRALIHGDLDRAVSTTNDLPAIAILARRLGDVFENLAHGKLADIVDVSAVRAEVEQALLDYALPKINLSYSFGTKVNALPDFFKMTDDGGNYPRSLTDDLSLNFELSLDLKHPGDRKLASKGVLQPFQVNIFGVLTLFFQEAIFTAGDGGSPHVDIRVAKVELQKAIEFIEALESWLSPSGGNGFYVDVLLAPPGVEAGFAIDLGTISIGEVAFINVSFGASVELPFDNRPALFRFNLARRASPFLISVAPFGGGGFLSVISDAKGLVGFEASFEFGAVVGFQFSVLAGQGRVTTGMYIMRSGDSAALSGFFVASGSAHVACFGISATLLISISQASTGGSVVGQATFTFSFSLGLTSIDYSVDVSRSIGKGWSSGSTGNLRGPMSTRSPTVVNNANREEILATLAEPQLHGSLPTRVRSLAKSMHQDWMTYRSYFDESL